MNGQVAYSLYLDGENEHNTNRFIFGDLSGLKIYNGDKHLMKVKQNQQN